MSFYIPIFQALNKSDARYVVVGGLATVLHGYGRLTADIDLIVDLAPEESRKLIDALLGIGLLPRLPVNVHDFPDARIRNEWAEQRGMVVFPLWNPDNPLVSVDLFVQNPIDFEDLSERAELVDIGGERIKIASIPDLITLKRLAGRSRDLEDIKQLEAILRSKAG